MFALIYFALFAVTLGCGAGLLLARRADHAAFWLMGAMFGIAANFLILSQELLAFVQIIVYVGAVMVLFLFVIMLLNLREPEPPLRESLTPQRIACYAMVALAAGMVVLGFLTGQSAEVFVQEAAQTPRPAPFSEEAVKEVVVDLLTTWIYPFEIISLLLLASVVGAIIIARRRPLLMIDAAEQPSGPASPSGRVSGGPKPTPAPSSSSPSGRLVKKTS
jgi:NADH-quinone oxidoreductase subunit J